MSRVPGTVWRLDPAAGTFSLAGCPDGYEPLESGGQACGLAARSPGLFIWAGAFTAIVAVASFAGIAALQRYATEAPEDRALRRATTALRLRLGATRRDGFVLPGERPPLRMPGTGGRHVVRLGRGHLEAAVRLALLRDFDVRNFDALCVTLEVEGDHAPTPPSFASITPVPVSPLERSIADQVAAVVGAARTAWRCIYDTRTAQPFTELREEAGNATSSSDKLRIPASARRASESGSSSVWPASVSPQYAALCDWLLELSTLLLDSGPMERRGANSKCCAAACSAELPVLAAVIRGGSAFAHALRRASSRRWSGGGSPAFPKSSGATSNNTLPPRARPAPSGEAARSSPLPSGGRGQEIEDGFGADATTSNATQARGEDDSHELEDFAPGGILCRLSASSRFRFFATQAAPLQCILILVYLSAPL